MPGSILIADDDNVSRKLLQRLLEIDDHADRALAPAREMVDVRLPRYNA